MCAKTSRTGGNLRALLAELTDKERIKGHHSPEGRAIRILSRAMSGLLARDLARLDVAALCDQAVTDWLKTRLELSPWSTRPVPQLLARAVERGWLSRSDAARLQKIHNARTANHNRQKGLSAESALVFCIRLIEKHW